MFNSIKNLTNEIIALEEEIKSAMVEEQSGNMAKSKEEKERERNHQKINLTNRARMKK